MRSDNPGKRSRDDWGRRSRDPFIRELQRNPKKYAILQATISVGLVLFWSFLIIGLIAYLAIMLL